MLLTILMFKDMGKSKFFIELTDREGTTLYYKRGLDKQEMINGALMTYTEYELTGNIKEAREFYDEYDAKNCLTLMKTNRPAWMEQFNARVYRMMGNKEFISVNTRPFAHILRTIKGYKLANEAGKKAIMEKLFYNDELYKACEYALNELNKLK
jgi:hypothetical protein